MAVATRDFEIPAGSTVKFVVDVIGGPDDLAGYTGKLQIRELRNDIIPLVVLDPSNIVVNSGTRQVTVTIPGAESATYDWRRGVYDLLITGPLGDPWRLVEGRVTLSQAVTRED